MLTVPAQIFCAPTRAALIAALRSMPGVWAVLGSSEWPGMTRTPSYFHFGGDAWWSCCDTDMSILRSQRPGDRSGMRLVRVFLFLFDHAGLPRPDHEQNQEASEQRDIFHQAGTSLTAYELAEIRKIIGVTRRHRDVDRQHDRGEARANVEDDEEREHDLDDRQDDRHQLRGGHAR